MELVLLCVIIASLPCKLLCIYYSACFVPASCIRGPCLVQTCCRPSPLCNCCTCTSVPACASLLALCKPELRPPRCCPGSISQSLLQEIAPEVVPAVVKGVSPKLPSFLAGSCALNFAYTLRRGMHMLLHGVGLRQCLLFRGSCS